MELPDLSLEVGMVGVLVGQRLAEQVLQGRAEVGAHGRLGREAAVERAEGRLMGPASSVPGWGSRAIP